MTVASYAVTASSAAPPDAVFAVLDDAPGWVRWAGPTAATATWEREGDPPPGGVGAIRRLGRWPLYGREQILAYDPPHHMAYTVLSGVPVRDYRAEVDLRADRSGTLISWHATFEPKLPGTGGLLAAALRRLIGGYARRAAAEAERRHQGGVRP